MSAHTHPHNTGKSATTKPNTPPRCRRRCDDCVPSIFSIVIVTTLYILNTAFLHPVSASPHSETSAPNIFATVCMHTPAHFVAFDLSIFVSLSRARLRIGVRVCIRYHKAATLPAFSLLLSIRGI